jgi:hypothetical protein
VSVAGSARALYPAGYRPAVSLRREALRAADHRGRFERRRQ